MRAATILTFDKISGADYGEQLQDGFQQAYMSLRALATTTTSTSSVNFKM